MVREPCAAYAGRARALCARLDRAACTSVCSARALQARVCTARVQRTIARMQRARSVQLRV